LAALFTQLTGDVSKIAVKYQNNHAVSVLFHEFYGFMHKINGDSGSLLAQMPLNNQ